MIKCIAPSSLLIVCALIALTAVGEPVRAGSGTVEATLNGLVLKIDQNSGTILEMSYPGVGKMLETSAASGSILDVAFPIREFEPLRLAPRYSAGAKVEKTTDSVTIAWDRLGASRKRDASSPVQTTNKLEYDESTKRMKWVEVPGNPFDFPGYVSASVTLKAAPDGRSIVMTCTVDNQSQQAIPQIAFPDFMGLLPFDGEDNTQFRCAGFASKPFKELKVDPKVGIGLYAADNRFAGVEYLSGAYFGTTPLIAKWIDFGSLDGGFSLFRKRWNWGRHDDWLNYQERVWLRLPEVDNKLRMACLHKVDVKPGQKWTSEEYLLTPHRYGWAKGIEPYRDFVTSNLKRKYPVPKHVREGIGFQTIYMTEAYWNDPNGDYTFKISDLPALAKEAKEHGIDELCLWVWNWNLQVPVTPPFPQIGTIEDMKNAYEECKNLGVNLNLFISLMSVANPTAQRWGLEVPPPESGWTYHQEFVPQMRPYYGTGLSCAWISPGDNKWQDGVWNACNYLIDEMTPSIGWDQWGGAPAEPGGRDCYTMTDRVRDYAKQKDPESTLNGESSGSIDAEAEYLDYTWSWGGWSASTDIRPLNSVYPAPRVNANVDRSAREVRGCFVDNRYINVFTSKIGGFPGSGRIADHPELSAALKQCAKLKKQFLPYFVDGTLIGDCILSKPCPGTRISAYVLPDRALVVVMNDSGKDAAFEIDCNLAPWVASTSGSYEVKAYGANGESVGVKTVSAKWIEHTAMIGNTNIALYEVIATSSPNQ